MINASITTDIERLAQTISSGSKVAISGDNSGVSMSLTHAMIRNRVRNLHLVCVPTSGIQAELLIGAGCVQTLETSAITLGEHGTAHRFHAGLKSGAFRMLDATCPAIYSAIQAAGKGIPFLPMRGLLGSDLLRSRGDWKVINNPLSEADDPIVLLPAIKPDFAIFHVPYADRNGNVFIGRRRELLALAHAAKQSLVTVEEVRDIDLLQSEESAAGTLTANYISGIGIAPRGASPVKLWNLYDYDEEHLKVYGQLARTDEGFASYVKRFITG